MWTLADDNEAWLEGWWINSTGITKLEYVLARAAEDSDLHVRALQHVALCKLTNTNPELQSMKWTNIDDLNANSEGWGVNNKALYFGPSFFPSRKVFMLYMHQNATLYKSALHIKALRNTQ